MFSNRDLRNLIIPLFVEQFLLMLVGIADTFMVSFSSEADVSGVSLVTSFNTVLIFLFTALSSGGAVIISQYIGSKQQNEASRSAGQLLMVSTVISVAMTVPILSAAAVTVFCFSGRNPVRYKAAYVFSWDNVLLKKIMGIALPNGVENGIHQLVKVALSSMVALFGLWLGWGVIGVAVGMSIDLVFRGAIFIWRYKSQRWTQFQLI